MRLKFVEIKETPKEVGSRKAEAALEVSKENNSFTGFRHRFDFIARKPAGYSFRNPPGPV